MKPLKLSDIASACEGKLHGDKDAFIKNIVTDSRQADKNSLLPLLKVKKLTVTTLLNKQKKRAPFAYYAKKNLKQT